MSKSLTKKINIFLTVDLQTIDSYFNKHDPAPLYKRQLSHQLVDYIKTSVETAKRHSVIFYKLKCTGEIDRQYAEPLMYAIRRHYTVQKSMYEEDFRKFKKRTWILLALALVAALICQGFLPLLISVGGRVHWIIKSIVVFSWVTLWKPIERLVFDWNPHLKDISLMHRLATGEAIIIEAEQAVVKPGLSAVVNMAKTG